MERKPLPFVLRGLFPLLCLAGTVTAQDAPIYENVDLSGLATVTRFVDKTYPVSDDAQVFISNQFGSVRVVAWDEPIVRVTAELRVGARTSHQAHAFAQATRIAGNHVGERIEVRTEYPPTPGGEEFGYATDMEISVPATAQLELENMYGDVSVEGIHGPVTIDARFGIVELRDLDSAVRVRAKGQFPLIAERLRGGGTFTLRSTQASFSAISDFLHVDNYLGSIALRDPGENLVADLTCESGPIHLYLKPNAAPNLRLAADFGDVRSDLAIDSIRWGDTVTARIDRPDAAQSFELFTSFGDIHVHQAGLVAEPEPLFVATGAPVRRSLERDYELPPGNSLRIHAIQGDIHILGHDGDRVRVTAHPFVRVQDLANANLALEGLAFRAEFGENTLGLVSAVQEDMAAIGCTEYRMDLIVHVPRDTPLDIQAADGTSVIENHAAPLVLQQQRGAVELRNLHGAAEAVVAEGDIIAENVGAALRLESRSGDVTVRHAYGDATLSAQQGSILVESPNAAVHARSHGGDIRVIALDGVRGDYDLAAENGNISVAVPDEASAVFVVDTYGGSVSTWVPLTGTTERNTHHFQGRMNGGEHRILLETRNGNIAID